MESFEEEGRQNVVEFVLAIVGLLLVAVSLLCGTGKILNGDVAVQATTLALAFVCVVVILARWHIRRTRK